MHWLFALQVEKIREKQLHETAPKFEPTLYSQPVKDFEGSAVSYSTLLLYTDVKRWPNQMAHYLREKSAIEVPKSLWKET